MSVSVDGGTSVSATPRLFEESIPLTKLELLQLAAEEGDFQGLVSLLNDKNVNHSDPVAGLTLLSIASSQGHTDIVKYLLERGAGPEISDTSGYTSLHRAVWNNQLDVVKLLCEYGASPENPGSKNAGSVIGLACVKDHREIVKYLLLFQNSIINVVDRTGRSPLSYAAMSGNVSLVEFLLQNGSIPTQGNAIPLCNARAQNATTQSQQQLYRTMLALFAKYADFGSSLAGIQ